MLTLITINYNSVTSTESFLRSLSNQTDRDFDVIVVDNDSRTEDRGRLGAVVAALPFPVDVIHARTNTGFSGGNNLGIRKALAQGADWVVLLNNDVTVGREFIASLKEGLPPAAAIVGLPIREGDQVVYGGTVRWLRPTLEHRTTPETDTMTYAIGAAVAIHRDVIGRIGFMDERYFLYFEDAEYSMRARRAGIPLIMLRKPTVEHSVSSSTSSLGAPMLLRYHYRNAVRFTRQHAPLWARALLPFWILATGGRQIIKWCLRRARPESVSILRGLIDGVLDRGGNIRRRPRIAVECESLEDESWGVARQIRSMLIALSARPDIRDEYELVLYFKSRVPDEAWIRQPHIRTVIVRPFAWLPPSFSLYFFVFFPIRVWLDRPAVTYIANYMLPLLFLGKSIVMLTEDVWHEMRNDTLPLRYRVAYRIFATWAAHKATRIMAISDASAKRLTECFHIPSERISVNPLAVSPPTPTEGNGEPGDFFLYVAQALPRRHLRETIMAFADIAARHPTYSLIVIGPDKYRPPIIDDLVRSCNSAIGRQAIIRYERVDDATLARLYRGARAVVYVSDMEAFGLPPVEALTYGTPSILLDAPVHREIFGPHAFYTTSPNVSDIARQLERSIMEKDTVERIRQAAPSIVSRYTWEAHAQRMADIIRHIIRL